MSKNLEEIVNVHLSFKFVILSEIFLRASNNGYKLF